MAKVFFFLFFAVLQMIFQKSAVSIYTVLKSSVRGLYIVKKLEVSKELCLLFKDVSYHQCRTRLTRAAGERGWIRTPSVQDKDLGEIFIKTKMMENKARLQRYFLCLEQLENPLLINRSGFFYPETLPLIDLTNVFSRNVYKLKK